LPHFVISALSAVAYGGYTYFRNILLPLAEVDPVNRYTVLVKPQHLAELAVRKENFRFVAVPACAGSVAKRMAWEQVALPGMLRRLGADVVYTANNVGLLWCDTPVVIAVRNLEPFFHTAYEDGGKARARNRTLLWLTKKSVERAARVVAVSEYTKEVVSARYGNSGKMRVVYHGRPEVAPDEEAAGALRARHGLDGEYFLANSKFVPYGNLHTLIEGYGRAVGKDPRLPKLVLAGGDASRLYKEKVLGAIRTYRLQDRIVLPGLVPYPTNLALIRGAKLFLFPTLLEACPNALIEAMSMGCVVVSSDRPPMREIAGDSVLYFRSEDPGDLAEKIHDACGMSEAAASFVRSAAHRRSLGFSWEKSARRLVSVLEAAAGWATSQT
jgi:glycosyltransferase involved in cell wall biosynthesis